MKKSILIVDDEPVVLAFLQDVIKSSFSDIIVFSASTGEEALRLVHEQNIGLVTSDLMLPDKNGIEVLAEIKKYDSNIQVIICTAFGTTQYATQAMKLGASFPEGPFEAADRYGLDKVKEKMVELEKELGECYSVPKYLG